MKQEDRIVRDGKICGGEPVFRGTRVTLRTVLASLAASDSVETILAAFPALKTEDVQAAIAFAAASAEEDLPVPATPHIVGIRRGLAQAKTGEGRSAGDVLDELEREA